MGGQGGIRSRGVDRLISKRAGGELFKCAKEKKARQEMGLDGPLER